MKPSRHAGKWTPFLIWLLYVCFIAWYKFNYHELWKDEWQAWLLSVTTDSFRELFNVLPMEGHPPLWYVIQRIYFILLNWLYIDLSGDKAIQSIHLLIYAAAVFILIVRFRIPLWMRIGFVLTYFLGFEYGIVNRGYALLMFISFVLSDRCRNSLKKPVWLEHLLLFLLCLTEVYGVFIAIAYMVYRIIEHKNNHEKLFTKFSCSLLLTGMAGIAAFLGFIYNPEVSGTYSFFQAVHFNILNIILAFQGCVSSVFWTGLQTTAQNASVTSVGLGGVACIILFILFRRNPAAGISYLFFLISMILFTSVFYMGGLRQWGIHLVFFVFILNMTHARFNSMQKKVVYLFVCSMLLFQIRYNSIIFRKDMNEYYSNAILAGRYIEKHIAKDVPIFAVNKFFCTPVGGYAGRPLYSFPYGERFTYFKWREALFIPDIRDLIIQKKRLNVRSIYLLSYKPLPLEHYPGLQSVIRFDTQNIRQENYYLYKY